MQTLQTPSEVRAHDARAEIDRLMTELHRLVSRSERSGRDAIEEALPTAAQLQVVTANVDACNPSRRPGIAAELVALADRHARMRQDAIERGLAYTADTTMRRFLGETTKPTEIRPLGW
jgi:hypothetical protein